MSPERLVFTRTTPPVEFERFARNSGWKDVPRDDEDDADVDEDRPNREWRTSSGTVVFTDDTVIECQYVDVRAKRDVETIRDSFPCLDRGEAVAALDLSQEADAVRRGYRLAAATVGDNYDPTVFTAAVAGFRDPRPAVRQASLIVPQYARWPEFLAEVTALEERETDQDVKALAGGIRMLLSVVGRLRSQ